MEQLISYIALGAPATRRPACGDEPFLRPEFGFTPQWYCHHCGLRFGARWHRDPAYRRDCIVRAAREIRSRFGAALHIGTWQDPDRPRDLLTGTFGAMMIPGLFGVPLHFPEDDWPWIEPGHALSDREADGLVPPELDRNPFWDEFLGQLDWIERECGRIAGFINWQGALNSAYRLRGLAVYRDIAAHPERARHLFDCIVQVMLDGARRLQARQRQSGFDYDHFTVSNCLVNTVSPAHYRDLLLPFDRRLAESFGSIGVHNCAWNADPYVPFYATLPRVSYIDMGLDSDLAAARAAFPHARRAVMYKPTDLAANSRDELTRDLARIAQDYAPCDLVCADIDTETPDRRVLEVAQLCHEFSIAHASDPA